MSVASNLSPVVGNKNVWVTCPKCHGKDQDCTQCAGIGRVSIDPTTAYVRGEISEATWKKKLNQEKRANAPTREQVLTQVREREKQQGHPIDHDKTYNGYTNWDTWETMLILENSQQSDRWLQSWRQNFDKKIKAGTFTPSEAEKAVDKYIIPAARRESSRQQFGRDFTPDANIDPKKVNKAEVVRMILEHGE